MTNIMNFSGYELTNLWYGLGIFMTFLYIGTWRKRISKFMEDLNNHQPNIKFTYTSSRNCVSFIGLDVHLLKGELTIDLPIKLTDRHQYLNFTSSYSNHRKCSIIVPGNVTSASIFHKMKTWFLRPRMLES